jgi:hypothetical protein
VQVTDATWRAATSTVAGVGDLMQRTGDGRTDRVLGGRAVCKLFALKTTRTVFVGLVLKSVATVSNGLISKSAATVFSSLVSKLVATVSPGCLKTGGRFLG